MTDALKFAGITLALTAGALAGVAAVSHANASSSPSPSAAPAVVEMMPPDGWTRHIRIGTSDTARYPGSTYVSIWSDCDENGVARVSVGGSVATGGEVATISGKRIGSCHLVAYQRGGFLEGMPEGVLTVVVRK